MTTHPQDVPGDGPSGTTNTPDRPPSAINVNLWERATSAALGGTLVTLGLRRRSLGGAATALAGGLLFYRGISGHSRLYRALDVSTVSGRDRDELGAPTDAVEVERSITIGKPPDELYQFWREPKHLTRIMGHFAEVTSASADRQRWIVHGPLDRSASWETQVVEDRPGEFLRWESLKGAALSSESSVSFRPAPGDRGTEVTLHVRFDPPGGALGNAAITQLDIVPSTLVNEALRRFKSLAETGEIPTLEHNPSARGSGDLI